MFFISRFYRKTFSCFATILLLVFFTSFFPVMANDSESLSDMQEELDELYKEGQKYQGIINLKQREQTLLSQEINSINAEVSQVEEKIRSHEEDVSDIERELERLGHVITEKEELEQLHKDVLAQLVRSYYEDSLGKDLSTLFSSDFNALSDEDRLIQTGDKIDELLTETQSLRKALETDRREQTKRKKDLTTLQYQLEQRTQYLASTRSYKQTLVAQTQGELNKYGTKLTKVQEEQSKIQREIEQIESGKVDSVDFDDVPSKKEANFDYPTSSVKITQGYGKTSFSHNYGSGLHNGVDFDGETGDKIKTVADGKVVATGDMGRYGYGKWVAVDHENNLVTLYGHMSSVSVSKGKKVDQGDTVGKMGNTGYSTGSHLHFTVFYGPSFGLSNSASVSGLKIPTGASINPMNFF
ncbi:MAG: peptidoglycan DD-metalloendopeptidase family protein [Candidatus Moranbacteria bacterium]|nr:peptidoglycan DD-metalloendopeptidase family protein [Candidatus Moranbacteria bacterium]